MIVEEFRALGVIGEIFRQFRLSTFDLVPASDLAEVKAHLQAGPASGRWEYGEADVSEEWRAL